MVDETARVRAKLGARDNTDASQLHHGGTPKNTVSSGKVMRTDPNSGVLSYVDVSGEEDEQQRSDQDVLLDAMTNPDKQQAFLRRTRFRR